MKTILAPTDFSTTSINAVHYAVDLAKAINARLVLFHAIPFPIAVTEISVPDDFLDEMMEVGQRDMDELHKEIEKRADGRINVSTVVKMGRIEQEMENISFIEKPFAIVMGIRSGKSLERALMGSSVFHVVNHVFFPTLIIPENASFTGIHRIGIACDLKKVDDKLPFEVIAEWLSLFNAKPEIINIAISTSDFKVDQLAESIGIQNRLSDFNPGFHFLTGKNIADEMDAFIKIHPIDLLMVFPRKHGIFALFHKKVSKQIVAHNQIPILSVHDM